MNNKFMFEAKRLDNGILINGAVVYAPSGRAWIVEFTSASAAYPYDPRLNAIEIDPSTIKPLFTTGNRDAWLFDNVDKETYRNLQEDKRAIIHDYIMNDISMVQCYQMQDREWVEINHDFSSIFFGAIYRVRAPGYSIDDACNEVTALNPGSPCLSSLRILKKFAKANGLGGNDE